MSIIKVGTLLKTPFIFYFYQLIHGHLLLLFPSDLVTYKLGIENLLNPIIVLALSILLCLLMMLLLNTVPNAPSVSSPIFTDNPGRLLEEHMHDINVNNFAKCVFSQRGFSVWKIANSLLENGTSKWEHQDFTQARVYRTITPTVRKTRKDKA